jgi:hypothetical protein
MSVNACAAAVTTVAVFVAEMGLLAKRKDIEAAIAEDQEGGMSKTKIESEEKEEKEEEKEEKEEMVTDLRDLRGMAEVVSQKMQEGGRRESRYPLDDDDDDDDDDDVPVMTPLQLLPMYLQKDKKNGTAS